MSHPLRARRIAPALVAALLSSLAIALAAPGAALAAPCSTTLTDAQGEIWDLDSDGEYDDGTTDAYDRWGYASVDNDSNDENPSDDDFDSYSNPDSEACGLEDGEREIVFPTDDVDGLELTRKVFVPSSGLAFARRLDTIRNPGDVPADVSYRLYGNMGTDDTVILASADGDTRSDVGEPWVAAADADYSPNTRVAMLWDGLYGPDRFDRFFDDVYGDGEEDDVELEYDGIVIPPGGSVTFMHIDYQSTPDETTDEGTNEGTIFERAAARSGTPDEADDQVVAFAEANEAGPDELYAGMGEDEIGRLRNWQRDVDGDGARNVADTCPTIANVDQGDMDRDGLGDACDDDIDGDGLTNAQEGRLGLDPRKADTDGDGKPDGVDRCGTQGGAAADGCPGATVTTLTSVQSVNQAIRRLRANRLTAKVTRKRTRRGVRLSTTGSLMLPAGVTRAQGCGTGGVAVQVKAGKRTVSTRLVALKDDCTFASSVSFASRGRLGRRTLKVTARFLGNDRLFRRNSSSVSAGRA